MWVWLEVGVLFWADAVVRVDMGLGATFGRVRGVGKEHRDGWESSAMVLTAVGNNRAHYDFEPLFYFVLTLWDIHKMWKQKTFTFNTLQRRQMFPSGKGSFQMTDIAEHTF